VLLGCSSPAEPSLEAKVLAQDVAEVAREPTSHPLLELTYKDAATSLGVRSNGIYHLHLGQNLFEGALQASRRDSLFRALAATPFTPPVALYPTVRVANRGVEVTIALRPGELYDDLAGLVLELRSRASYESGWQWDGSQ